MLIRQASLAVVVALLCACSEPQKPVSTPATIRLVSGDEQLQIPGGTLADPLVVQVLDRAGVPVPGVAVTWSVLVGGGSITESSTTDNSGEANTTWILGPAEGIQRVSVSCSGASDQSFLARSVAGPRDIAFTSSNGAGQPSDLYIMDSDGNNVVQLTSTSRYSESFPEWSPDGMKVAFVRTGSSDSWISVIDFSLMIEARLMDDSDAGFIEWGGLSWSPNGEHLLFSRNDEVHSLAVDSSGIQALGISGNSAVWSPDGSEIAYSRLQELYVADADGSNERQLTSSDSYWSFTPRWSPDGSKLLFFRKNPGAPGCGVMQIWMMNADGSDLLSVAETTEQGGTCGGGNIPDWSPDGLSLVYEFAISTDDARCAPNTTLDLVVLDLTSRDTTVVADQRCENMQPSWRPAVN